MFPKEGFRKIMEMILIDHGFEFPITFVMIGVNGAFLIARFEMIGQEFKEKVLTGKAKNLRFPINTMFVDAKGRAAHVSFERSGEYGKLMHCLGQSEPSSIGWPRA